jgi:endoglucanase
MIYQKTTAFTVQKNIIYDHQHKVYNLSGISWFGFETQDFVINGLWVHDVNYYIDLIRENGFNTLRIPFSAEWILYNFDLYPYDGLLSADASIQHKKSIEILDKIFDICFDKNINIMLDLHRLHKEYISELWYSPTDNMYPSEYFLKTWYTLLDRYQNYTNLIAIDLLNEPHGQATWGGGNPSTDWNAFVEFAIPHIQQRYPNSQWLYVVEGINWGKDLTQVLNHPLEIHNITNRLVYSAHCYGRSVVTNLDIYNIQALRSDWESSFGYIIGSDSSLVL